MLPYLHVNESAYKYIVKGGVRLFAIPLLITIKFWLSRENPLDSRTVHDKLRIYRYQNSSPGLFTLRGHKYEAINFQLSFGQSQTHCKVGTESHGVFRASRVAMMVTRFFCVLPAASRTWWYSLNNPLRSLGFLRHLLSCDKFFALPETKIQTKKCLFFCWKLAFRRSNVKMKKGEKNEKTVVNYWNYRFFRHDQQQAGFGGAAKH